MLVRTADNHYIIEHVIAGHWSPAKRDEIILRTARGDAQRYDNQVLIYVEQEGGSGGLEVSRQLVTKLAGFPIYSDNVSGARSRTVQGLRVPGQAKVVRALPLAAQAEIGNVSILAGSWNADELDQLSAFPESSLNDIVDACCGAFAKLAGRSGSDWVPPTGEQREGVAQGAERFGGRLMDLQKTRRARGGRGF